jgi:hypothetical protein
MNILCMGASRKASNADQADKVLESNVQLLCSLFATTCEEQERAGDSAGTSIRVSERPMVVMTATLHNIISPPIKIYALLLIIRDRGVWG